MLCNSDQRDLKLGIVDQRATAEKERRSMENRAKQSRSKLTHQEEKVVGHVGLIMLASEIEPAVANH